ncbi:hypothetical protein ABPG72_019809 [Tetrahymena utriculariae]
MPLVTKTYSHGNVRDELIQWHLVPLKQKKTGGEKSPNGGKIKQLATPIKGCHQKQKQRRYQTLPCQRGKEENKQPPGLDMWLKSHQQSPKLPLNPHKQHKQKQTMKKFSLIQQQTLLITQFPITSGVKKLPDLINLYFYQQLEIKRHYQKDDGIYQIDDPKDGPTGQNVTESQDLTPKIYSKKKQICQYFLTDKNMKEPSVSTEKFMKQQKVTNLTKAKVLWDSGMKKATKLSKTLKVSERTAYRYTNIMKGKGSPIKKQSGGHNKIIKVIHQKKLEKLNLKRSFAIYQQITFNLQRWKNYYMAKKNGNFFLEAQNCESKAHSYHIIKRYKKLNKNMYSSAHRAQRKMEIENEGSSETSYQLSEEERWAVIISFKYFNLKQVQICEKYPFATKSNVSKIIKKYNETGSVQNKPKSGRPSIIQQHPNISEMVQTVLQDANRVCSSRQVQEYLENDFQVSISKDSANKILKELGFKYGRVNMIHKLTDENKVQRLKYCKHAIRNAFHNIIFSDECVFSIRNNNLKIWYNSQNPKAFSQKENQYKDTYVHVWGAIGRRGKSSLYFHSQKVGSDQYIQCLEESLLPFVDDHFDVEEDVFLLQDGAPSHTSKKSKEWFEDTNIEILQNPSWSPDLNPIELIWNTMKQKFKQKLIIKKFEDNSQLTQENIKEIVTEIWQDIDDNIIKQSISHTKKIMKQVIELQGDYCKSYI